MDISWTNTKPAKPGWYWYELEGGFRDICFVCFLDITNFKNQTFHKTSTFPHRAVAWAGPIQEPNGKGQ